MKFNKNKVYIITKFLLGIILICFLVLRIDVSTLIKQVRSINIYWLFLVFVLSHLNILLSSIKWQWLLKALGIAEDLLHLFFLYLIGTFFSNFLPTMAGGDVVRVFQLAQKTSKFSSVVAATFAERFLGLTALITFFSFIFFFKNIYNVFPAIKIVALLLVLGYSVVILLIFRQKYLSYLAYLDPFKRFRSLKNILDVLVDSQSKVLLFKEKRLTVIASYVISLFFYGIAMLSVYAAAKSFGIDIDAKVIIVVVSLVLIIGLLPISVNGLGINEASYVFFFTLFGISNVDAVSVALLLRTRILLTGMLGGLIYMFYDRSPANESSFFRYIHNSGHNR